MTTPTAASHVRVGLRTTGCPRRIEIVGGVASGKTSFAALFRKSPIRPVFERFRTNPFWRVFFAAPKTYAFETEVTFLLQHYHAIKRAGAAGKDAICDFSIFLDSAYAKLSLGRSQYGAFMSVYREVTHDVAQPDAVVVLQCDAAVEMQRVQQRARREESLITTEFLKQLDGAISEVLEHLPPGVERIPVDSVALNFVADTATKTQLVDLVCREYLGRQAAGLWEGRR